MTFEGRYLTYAEYQNLGGSAIGEMPFNVLEFEARRQIDLRTFNRMKDLESTDIPMEAKMCDYALINAIMYYSKNSSGVSNNGNVASENTDGYSISYVTADRISEVVKSKSAEMDDIVKTYLLGVVLNDEHLMYCGVE